MKHAPSHTRWLFALACAAAMMTAPGHAAETLVTAPIVVDTTPAATARHARAAAADIVRATTVKRGDTLNHILRRWGVPHAQAMAWDARLPSTRRPRDLRVGDRVRACISPGKRLEGLAIRTRTGRTTTLGRFPVPARRTPPSPKLTALFQPPASATQVDDLHRVQLQVERSLDAVLEAHRISSDEIAAIQASLKENAGLPHNFPSGTPVGLLLEPTRGDHPRLLRMRIWYASKIHELFSYIDASGRRWTLNRNGSGVLHLPLGMPVENARITSGWGWRDQPVHHVPEFHKGIDYAAPFGTPVHAAASGVVQFIGWRGNYGKLITIAHTPDTQTRYAHLSRAAADLHVGSLVRSGQVIGYIGSTGLSTGPHLYFEL